MPAEETGWVFDVEEVSANVYRVSGEDRAGRRVERTGLDPDSLLEQCKKDAAELAEDTQRGRPVD